jgi:predicted nucleic acid-binding protein
MRILVDTSVMVAGIVQAHPGHTRALPWLAGARNGEHECVFSCHSLLELFAVLTSLPLHPRIRPDLAHRLIVENIESSMEAVELSAADYRSVLGEVKALGLTGGIVYDALIAFAAHKAKVDRLLTFNVSDFKRVWPECADRIIAP